MKNLSLNIVKKMTSAGLFTQFYDQRYNPFNANLFRPIKNLASSYSYNEAPFIPCLFKKDYFENHFNQDNFPLQELGDLIFYKNQYLAPFLFEKQEAIINTEIISLLKTWYATTHALLLLNEQTKTIEEEMNMDDLSVHENKKKEIYHNLIRHNIDLNTALVSSHYSPQFFNILNPDFWMTCDYTESYHNKLIYISLGTSSTVDRFEGLCYENPIDDIVNLLMSSFENKEDVISFENFIFHQYQNSIPRIQKRLCLEAMKKIIPENSLSYISPLQHHYIHLLNDDSLYFPTDDLIDILDLANLSEFHLVQDLFLSRYHNATDLKLAQYLHDKLSQHNLLPSKDFLYLEEQEYLIYHKTLQLNFNYLKDKVNQNIFLVVNLLHMLVKAYNDNQLINKDSSFYPNQINLNIDSQYKTVTIDFTTLNEQDISSFSTIFNRYIEGTFNSDYLSPETIIQLSAVDEYDERIEHSDNEAYMTSYVEYLNKYFFYQSLDTHLDNNKLTQPSIKL